MEAMSEEKIEQIKEILKDIDFDNTNQGIIQDNKIIFVCENKVYRCKMPNQRIQSECEDEKNIFQIKLLKEGKYVTRNKLKEILKKNQDIDIDELEEEKLKIKDTLKDAYLDLASIPTSSKEKLIKQKEKVQKIREDLIRVTFDICESLAPCLEERVMKRYYEYLAYSCTEKQTKKEHDTWEKNWFDYEEFEKDETKLSYKAIEYIRILLMDTRE